MDKLVAGTGWGSLMPGIVVGKAKIVRYSIDSV